MGSGSGGGGQFFWKVGWQKICRGLILQNILGGGMAKYFGVEWKNFWGGVEKKLGWWNGKNVGRWGDKECFGVGVTTNFEGYCGNF